MRRRFKYSSTLITNQLEPVGKIILIPLSDENGKPHNQWKVLKCQPSPAPFKTWELDIEKVI